ncbi:MAG: NAD(+)/NADH kinase [Lachnospiraceae bacterium]|nr:NAD(+)/NADH kinase [Lachnospiraceae bacterium]
MDRGMNKIIIVKRKTRLEDLKKRYNTIEQARFYVEHLGADFGDYELEHNNYYCALKKVHELAQPYARIQEIDREYVPNMIFGAKDIIIAVGQDGLVANVMKYLDGQPLIGINPDTKRWSGELLPFEPEDACRIIPKVVKGEFDERKVTMGKAETKDGQILYAVNDFFVGINNHTSARYHMCYTGIVENQSSSGVIISTGLGMTGWHKSVMAELRGMAKAFKLGDVPEPSYSWDCGQLTFQVREPYPSKFTQTGLVYGRVTAKDSLTFVSGMPENGVVFSDGILEDSIDFNSGMELKISVADREGRLVV